MNICKPGILIPSTPKEVAQFVNQLQDMSLQTMRVFIDTHNFWIRIMYPFHKLEEIDIGNQLPKILILPDVSGVVRLMSAEFRKFLP